MRVNDKSQALRLHFKRRLKLRYGIDINRDGVHSVIKDIQQGRSRHISSTSRSRSVQAVGIAGLDVIVVYDKNRKELVTALPPGCGGLWMENS